MRQFTRSDKHCVEIVKDRKKRSLVYKHISFHASNAICQMQITSLLFVVRNIRNLLVYFKQWMPTVTSHNLNLSLINKLLSIKKLTLVLKLLKCFLGSSNILNFWVHMMIRLLAREIRWIQNKYYIFSMDIPLTTYKNKNCVREAGDGGIQITNSIQSLLNDPYSTYQ